MMKDMLQIAVPLGGGGGWDRKEKGGVLTKGPRTPEPAVSLHAWRDPACTNGETERLQGFRRDPLWVKIREVGRGLSLADTQTGR